MKRIHIALIVGICASASTMAHAVQANSVIDALVKEKKLNRVDRNPPGAIQKYLISGKEYYHIDAECCDQYNDLYDNHGKYVCSPSGGFTGGGNRIQKCPTLDWDHRVDQGIVWRATQNSK